MLEIVSLDKRTMLNILFIGDDCSDTDTILTSCALTRGGRTARVESLFSRNKLEGFGAELSKLHHELLIGSFVSIWSAQGNLAISLSLCERGVVACNVILAGEGIDMGLYAIAMIDQSYLPEISAQFIELSRACSSYSN